MLKNELPYLRRLFGVKRMALFGSFAKGTQRHDSDVDLYVEFDKPVGLAFFKLTQYLEKKLGRKTDVITPGGLVGIRIPQVAEDIKRSLVYVSRRE